MWSLRPREFIPGCGADIILRFCSGSAASGIRQMECELDLAVPIARI